MIKCEKCKLNMTAGYQSFPNQTWVCSSCLTNVTIDILLMKGYIDAIISSVHPGLVVSGGGGSSGPQIYSLSKVPLDDKLQTKVEFYDSIKKMCDSMEDHVKHSVYWYLNKVGITMSGIDQRIKSLLDKKNIV